MARIQEVSELVDVEVRKEEARLFINEDIVTVSFADMPALSRACSIVKESSQYAAWLEREGKA